MKTQKHLPLGTLVSHRRHGFGRVVGCWQKDLEIYDIIFHERGFPFQHSCHRRHIVPVPIDKI